MASNGQVTLNGRFSAGTVVRLVEVDGDHVMRSEGGREVDTKRVDSDGRVQFKSGVKVGARYFVVGIQQGSPLEVPVRGNTADGDVVQAPIQPDRIRLADGRWQDEVIADARAAKKSEVPKSEVGPAPGQHQVPAGVQQRSDTPLGTATPVDPKERAPFPPQDDVAKRQPQRSDTERGQATPIPHLAAPAQSDSKSRGPQRSDTPRGSATPIPAGDAIEAVLNRDSAQAKAAVGEPGKAASLPVDVSPPAKAEPDEATAPKASSRPRKASGKRTASSGGSRKSSPRKR